VPPTKSANQRHAESQRSLPTRRKSRIVPFPKKEIVLKYREDLDSASHSRGGTVGLSPGERAECVMLNKGPYIDPAVRILSDILQRMQPHREKKNSLLRKLHLAVAF
jgi:hypothetical protein